MRLGNFSVSLAVKDIAKSREFYEKLGFRVVGRRRRYYKDNLEDALLMTRDGLDQDLPTTVERGHGR